MSAKIPLPKQILVHGYVTFNGKKISKSLGNAIDPNDVVPKYGVDQFRYTMIKEVPFNQDGDFSENSLKDRTNNELANDLGNLLSRTLSLCEKYFDGKLTKQKDDDLFKRLNLEKIEKHISNYELHLALDEIWSFIRSANKYVNDNEPWKNEENREVVLYNLLESLRISSLLLSSFMPETSEKINAQLGIKLGNIKDVKFGIIDKYIVKKGDILFNKIE